MVLPPHSGTGDLDALLDGKVDIAVSDDDVAAFAEGGDDGGDGGEALGVGDVTLQVDVHVYVFHSAP
jgi:hypothetical protein